MPRKHRLLADMMSELHAKMPPPAANFIFLNTYFFIEGKPDANISTNFTIARMRHRASTRQEGRFTCWISPWLQRPKTENKRLKFGHSLELRFKAAFHYLAICKSDRKPGRKQVETCRKSAANLLKTGNFYIPFVLHAHEPANLLRFATRLSTKKVESVSLTRNNLSKTWLQTWSKTRFAAG